MNDSCESRAFIPAAGILLLLTHVALAGPAKHIYVSKEAVAFADLKPGQSVAEFLSETGEFTTMLCQGVGEAGRVYVVTLLSPTEAGDLQDCKSVTTTVLRSRNFPAPELHSNSDDPGWVYEYYSSRLPVESFIAPEPLDLIWVGVRYGELSTKKFGSPNMVWVNAAWFNALKPGGILLVEALAEAASVKKEVTAAGFEFANELFQEHHALLKFRKPL